jgi:predicted ArsR family transcriptional regulator
MTDDWVGRLQSIGALAEPNRRALYLYVSSQGEPVSRDQAAAATGLPRHAVKFHLDRLVDEGLLAVEFRRLSDRRGPGAGRPAKLYRRAPGELSVSVPERRYELAGRILADAVSEAQAGTPITSAVAHAATAAGRRVGAQLRGSEPLSCMELLARWGYEPTRAGHRIVLVNCPFHALAAEHTELVCGLNLEFIRGMTDEAGLDADAQLEPKPGRCCVSVRAD